MHKNEINIVGLIPAKENSTRLKNKNLKKLNNLSLTEIAIISAVKSKFINRTFISTDSKKLIEKSQKYKISAVKREKKLCLKNVTSDRVILNFLGKIKKFYNFRNLIIVYLQPTSPFRNHKHINKAIKLFLKSKSKSKVLVSVVKDDFKFFKYFKEDKYFIKPYFKSDNISMNGQSFPQMYYPNGAIYIFFANEFLKKKKIKYEKVLKYEMDKISSIDIDDNEDFKISKLLSNKFLIYK